MYVITPANAVLHFTARNESWKAVVYLDFLLYSLEYGRTCFMVHQGVLRGYGLGVDVQVQQKENVLNYIL